MSGEEWGKRKQAEVFKCLEKSGGRGSSGIAYQRRKWSKTIKKEAEFYRCPDRGIGQHQNGRKEEEELGERQKLKMTEV